MQGVGKLSSPFLDTLSRYDASRSTAIETTWDQVQSDVGEHCRHEHHVSHHVSVEVLWRKLAKGLDGLQCKVSNMKNIEI